MAMFTHTTAIQIKGMESLITQIFGDKFRSTLRAPGQKEFGVGGELEGFEVGYSGLLFLFTELFFLFQLN